jgi:hypothetical protein
MSNISRRAVLSTGGRAAVATLSLGGLAVAAPSVAGDDPLIVAVDARRRLQAHIEAFSDAMPPGAWSEDDPVEVEFNRLCDEAAVDSWRLLEIEATSVAGVVAFLGWFPTLPTPLICGRRVRTTGGGM